MILAADIGGTKTLLGLFALTSDVRPREVAVRSYATADFSGFLDVLDAFARDVPDLRRVGTAAVGIAGPVHGDHAQLTNGTWSVDTREIAARLDGAPVALVNDLTAMAGSVTVLRGDELVTLQPGTPSPEGHAALIAAGTGLGMAVLPRIDGRLRIAASEGGHADFAPRTDREIALLRMLRARLGRVRVEDVLSGRGLVALHAFTHEARRCDASSTPTAIDPGAVSDAALADRCPACVEALDMFVDAYGAEAGNLALRSVATAGLYVGGGIAPKILPALTAGQFIAAFRDKVPMADLLARVPVRVILNPEAALLGAAILAAGQSHPRASGG